MIPNVDKNLQNLNPLFTINKLLVPAMQNSTWGGQMRRIALSLGLIIGGILAGTSGIIVVPVLILAGLPLLALCLLCFWGLKCVQTSILKGHTTVLGAVSLVLIIDDDTDLANISARQFQRNGFEVKVATTHDAAIPELIQGGYDLILLDWLLDAEFQGDDLIRSAVQGFEDAFGLRDTESLKPIRIISYSSFGADQIIMPTSEYFNHLAHWQKPMQPSQIKEMIQQTLAVRKDSRSA